MEDVADHAGTGCYAAMYALCAVTLQILIIRLPKKNAVSRAKDFHLSALSIILA
jgi:predicted transcriptional regulator